MIPSRYGKKRLNETKSLENAKKKLAEKVGRETAEEEIKKIRKGGFWRIIMRGKKK